MFSMKRHTLAALVAVAMGTAMFSAPAFSQSSYRPAIPANDALYQQLGGEAGLIKLMDDFMARLLADPRMNPFFKEVDQKHVKEQLVAQFCEVSGGPCKLKGPDMKRVHAGFDIDRASFNALVEVLQQAMDAQGISFSAQNKLLAQLAPMHRDIVNVK
jgi:hemoglobin